MNNECCCVMHYGRHDDYCRCGVHGPEQGYRRRFLTKVEKAEKLKNYAEELKKELEAVEEKIREVQS